jgi:hypothetical protein
LVKKEIMKVDKELEVAQELAGTRLKSHLRTYLSWRTL